MRRKLFSIPVMLSLLLCVATGLLWVRSYGVAQQIGVRTLRAGPRGNYGDENRFPLCTGAYSFRAGREL